MAKKPEPGPIEPRQEAHHEAQPMPAPFTPPPQITHPAASNGAPRASPGASSSYVPPPNVGPTPLDATGTDNSEAVITSQLALLAQQNIQATYLSSQLPPDITSLPSNPNLPSIIDTLAGASRALGAYVNQLNTLQSLWPPP